MRPDPTETARDPLSELPSALTLAIGPEAGGLLRLHSLVTTALAQGIATGSRPEGEFDDLVLACGATRVALGLALARTGWSDAESMRVL